MATGNSHDPLQEYLDSLFSDTALGAANQISENASHKLSEDVSHKSVESTAQKSLESAGHRSLDSSTHKDESALRLASGGNVAALPNTARTARVIPVRPYAEPIRTLNLRMPLPPVAPSPSGVDTPPVAEKVATKVVVEHKTETPPKVLVDTKIAETRVVEAPVIETPVVEIQIPVPTKTTTPVETKVERALEIKVKPAEPVSVPIAIPQTPSVEQKTDEPVTSAVTAQDSLAVMAPPAAWASNGRPQWAQQPFECLIFKAGGLQLAAPLVELGSIYPFENGALTEIFGQKQWFMGLLPVKEYNVRAMDTALVVMPERYEEGMREKYRYIVSLFGSDWGLAVDSVVGTTLLDPDNIRWRSERSKRPWLAGTLVDQMCALFDIAQLAWLFHNQDRKRATR